MNGNGTAFLDADAAFAALPPDAKVRLLLRLAWELTVVARDYYVPGDEGLTDPAAVRLLNEVQHRVTAHAARCLGGGDQDAPPGYGFVTDCWEHGGLRAKVCRAFERAYRPLATDPAAV